MTPSALGRLIALPGPTFGSEVWGQRVWLSRAADLPRSFDDLMSVDDVDQMVAVRGIRYPFVRMVKDGVVLPRRRFTGPAGAGAEIDDQLSSDRVFAEMTAGATLILQALHRTWPPLIDLVARLAAELGHPVQANAYITPAQSRGFAAHYDLHDVFVLQVEGHKTWQIWQPVIDAPMPVAQWRPTNAKELRTDRPAALQATLNPGDALYLPRGWIHSAHALGETSVHVTLGVHPVTRFDVVQAIATVLADDPELRRSLPTPLSTDLIEVSQVAAVRDQMRRSLETVDLATVAQELRRRALPRSRPLPVRPLAQAAAMASLDVHTWVRRRVALSARLEEFDSSLRLTLTDRVITFPLGTAEAVAALLSGQAQQPGRLPALDAMDGLVLVRRLLREAVLVPDDEPHPGSSR